MMKGSHDAMIAELIEIHLPLITDQIAYIILLITFNCKYDYPNVIWKYTKLIECKEVV